MPTISIIGCGWMGWPIAKFLSLSNYTIKGSTTSSSKLALLEADGIQPFLFNLDSDPVPDGLLDCDILFINFPPGRRAADLQSRYHLRIQKVIEAAKKAKVKKVIFASSTGVYAGSEDKPMVDERDTPQPLRTSAQAMWNAEQSLAKSFEQLTVLRFAGLVGAGRKASNFLAGKTNLPNPHHAVNLVHLADCIAIVTSIIQKDIWGETYNVVADEHPSRQDLYIHLSTEAGITPPTFSEQVTRPNKIVSNQKLKQDLGYQFIHPDPRFFPD